MKPDTDIPNRNLQMPTAKPALLMVLLAGLIMQAPRVSFAQPAGIGPDYLEILTRRADKIISVLGIEEPGRSVRVRDIIITQYYDLSKIHDDRDSMLTVAAANEQEHVRTLTDARLYRLHATYMAKLAVELSPGQIEMVKDGMTYGIMKHTCNAYLDLLEDLTEEQKRIILANLYEARELAMDAGSAEEKHAWFGKYKGRINNYLSDQGFDLKKAGELKNKQDSN